MSDDGLITELTVGMARRLTDILAPTREMDSAPEGYIHHGYTSAFEHGCGLLWQMGLATPDREDGTGFPAYFRLESERTIREKLASGLPKEAPPLPVLLEAFLALACDYGADAARRLPHNRAPFRPAPVNARVTESLAEHGYLKRDGDTYAWSDNVAPAMVAAHFWDAEGQDLSDLAEARVKTEARAALETLPQDISLTNVLALTDHLRHRWTGSDWQPLDAPRHDLAHLVPLARRILAEADTPSARTS